LKRWEDGRSGSRVGMFTPHEENYLMSWRDRKKRETEYDRKLKTHKNQKHRRGGERWRGVPIRRKQNEVIK